MSCVVCNAPFHVSPKIDFVVVGVGSDGRQVAACDTASCAAAIGYVPGGEQLAMSATVFTDLAEAQADGLACVVCDEDFTEFLGNTVPVGVSNAGAQVFACASTCAPSVGYVPPAAEAVRA